MWQPKRYSRLGRKRKILVFLFLIVAAVFFAGTIGENTLQFFLDRYGVVRVFTVGIVLYVVYGLILERLGFAASKSMKHVDWLRKVRISRQFASLLAKVFTWKVGKILVFSTLVAIPYISGFAGVLAERTSYPRDRLFWGSITFGRAVKGTYLFFLFLAGGNISSLVVEKVVTLLQTIVSYVS